jgi:hypothetical protein
MRNLASRIALGALVLASACSDTEAPADPGKACDEVASAMCDRLDQCSPPQLLALYGDRTTCLARMKLVCLPLLSAPGSKTTPATALQCASDIRAGSCDLYFTHSVPTSCLGVPGTLADGAACAAGPQCESTYCQLASGSSCGTCARRSAAAGPCSEESGCAPGLACAGGSCVAFGGVGSACGPKQPCRRDLLCRAGICGKPLEAAQPCDPLRQECNMVSGLYCGKSKLCSQASTAKAGEPCGLLDGGGVAICTGGATCTSLSGGLCQAAALDGAACDDQKGPHCLAPADCVGGICRIADPTACK